LQNYRLIVFARSMTGFSKQKFPKNNKQKRFHPKEFPRGISV
jgi:hypothetical protein